MIRLEQVSRSYEKDGNRVEALRQVQLHLAPGEMAAVVGPSGSGKTTLLNILGCLDRPTAGRYLLDGQPVERMTARQQALVRNRKIGLIFQQFHLLPGLSAEENAALPLTFRGIPLRQRREAARQALEQVGLGARWGHRPGELSGGQQQRVAIARVLCADPSVVLADEPTGNLDPEAAAAVMDILCGLHRAGKTVVIITHDAAVARIAPRLFRMESGCLTELTGRKSGE
ncbi:MAG: ABC transporter ATP-binding protein [Clostridia bacterium]|nr:ABC transporter ATP-binding protein [Clostridia bacterium]